MLCFLDKPKRLRSAGYLPTSMKRRTRASVLDCGGWRGMGLTPLSGRVARWWKLGPAETVYAPHPSPTAVQDAGAVAACEALVPLLAVLDNRLRAEYLHFLKPDRLQSSQLGGPK